MECPLIEKHLTNEERSHCIVREKESKRAHLFLVEVKNCPFISFER